VYSSLGTLRLTNQLSGLIEGGAGGGAPVGGIQGDGGAGIEITGGAAEITNLGLIQGGAGNSGGHGIELTGASAVISNDGTIQGGTGDLYTAGAGIFLSEVSTTTINNNGTINGFVGIAVANQGDTVSLTNSGTISGDFASVFSYGSGSITIAGNDTARFNGLVLAPFATMSIADGAIYTFQGDEDFRVASFTNNGALQITAGSTGTITGNFINTGTFSPTVTDSGYGKLVVSGTATLGGTLFVDVKNGGSSALLTSSNTYDGTVSDIITAEAVTGTFASTIDNSALYVFSPVYDDTSVGLTFVQDRSLVDVAVDTRNTPSTGAAGVLDSLLNTTTGSTGLDNLLAALADPALTDEEVSSLLSQTLPLLTSGAGLAIGNALAGTNRIVQARIEANRGLSSGEQFFGDQHFWLKPFGSWTDQKNRNGVTGYKADSYGLALGADATVSDQTRLGVAFVYGNSDVKSNTRLNTADIGSYQLVGYGSLNLSENTELNFQADVSLSKTDGRRTVTGVGTSNAKFDSWSTHIGMGLGHSYKLNERTSLGAMVRGDYTRIRSDSYTETGTGPNLSVGANTTEEFILGLDGKLNHALNDRTTLSANLNLGYDLINEQASITAAFVGGGATFVTRGIKPSPWLLRGGVGLNFQANDRTEVTIRYDAEYRQDFLNQSASVKVRWAF
jgi:autotransporter family porin